MREPNLSSSSSHVVVTGASGRYFNPLRETETERCYTHLQTDKPAHTSNCPTRNVKTIHHNE